MGAHHGCKQRQRSFPIASEIAVETPTVLPFLVSRHTDDVMLRGVRDAEMNAQQTYNVMFEQAIPEESSCSKSLGLRTQVDPSVKEVPGLLFVAPAGLLVSLG
jgi:hypothetical protein